MNWTCGWREETQLKTFPDLELARRERERLGVPLVVAKGGRVIATGERGGVADLLGLLRREDLDLDGSALSDRVVGKAAAMLARVGRVAAVHAGVLSDPAAQALEEGGIPCAADRRVPHILNRSGDGLCPLEQLSLAYSDPAECHAALEAWVAQMRARKG